MISFCKRLILKIAPDILSEYIEQAMSVAVYDRLQDDTFVGRIPICKGVIAFGAKLSECESELSSTLEDWILLGLKMGHPLPVISGQGR
ncbi:type II toxin-antitoxin system HicB family antitoxin [Candidatus Magnetobacterium casense]|uniref:type II toxin-antitoxin system HicB family antitoxin n=1 Tax=Candidatus Magnetobacterium casense TaxID=1455061 RepID=UPI00338D9EE6